MRYPSVRTRLFIGAVAVSIVLAELAILIAAPREAVQASEPPAQGTEAAPAAPAPGTPVSVALVEQRDVALWDEFSGRLEAVERVEVRSRVAGAVQAVHFREGALVKQGDLLVTIDPAPYAAEVERAEAQVAAARGARRCSPGARSSAASSCSDIAHRLAARPRPARQRAIAKREANLRAAKAALQSAQLNLGYTEVRAPVAGRVGTARDHRRQSGRRRARRAGADHAGVGRSDLRQLQCRRGGRDARARGRSAATAARTARSSGSRCR